MVIYPTRTFAYHRLVHFHIPSSVGVTPFGNCIEAVDHSNSEIDPLSKIELTSMSAFHNIVSVSVHRIGPAYQQTWIMPMPSRFTHQIKAYLLLWDKMIDSVDHSRVQIARLFEYRASVWMLFNETSLTSSCHALLLHNIDGAVCMKLHLRILLNYSMRNDCRSCRLQ